jgi:hypothetical protein
MKCADGLLYLLVGNGADLTEFLGEDEIRLQLGEQVLIQRVDALVVVKPAGYE